MPRTKPRVVTDGGSFGGEMGETVGRFIVENGGADYRTTRGEAGEFDSVGSKQA